MTWASLSLALTVFGALSEQETRTQLWCSGLFGSTNSGQSWGDFSVVGYDKEHRDASYSETDIAVVSDQLGVAFMCNEPRSYGGANDWMSRAIPSGWGNCPGRWHRPSLYL